MLGITAIYDYVTGGDATGDIVDTIEQSVDVISGEYNEDYAEIEDIQKEIEPMVDQFEAMQEELASIAILFDEIFTMSKENKLEEYGSLIEEKQKEAEKLVEEFNSNYSMIIELNGTFLGRIFLSPVMILGGIHYDLGQMIDGDIQATMRMVQLTISIATLVMMPEDTSTWIQVVAYLGVYLSLDATFGANGIMMATMQILDFMFNDVLQLEDWAHEDFGNFSEDSEHYEETLGYVSLTVTIALIISTIDFDAMMNQSDELASQPASEAAISAARDSRSLQNLLTVVQQASSYYEKKIAHEELVTELEDKMEMIEAKHKRADNMHRAKMLALEEAFTTPHEERVMLYEYGFDNNSYEVKDPMYLVPLDILDQDNKKPSETFNGIFNESKQAGSTNYFKNMLYSY